MLCLYRVQETTFHCVLIQVTAIKQIISNQIKDNLLHFPQLHQFLWTFCEPTKQTNYIFLQIIYIYYEQQRSQKWFLLNTASHSLPFRKNTPLLLSSAFCGQVSSECVLRAPMWSHVTSTFIPVYHQTPWQRLLLKSMYFTSTAFRSSCIFVTSSKNLIKLVRHDLPFTKPCCLSPISPFVSKCE